MRAPPEPTIRLQPNRNRHCASIPRGPLQWLLIRRFLCHKWSSFFYRNANWRGGRAEAHLFMSALSLKISTNHWCLPYGDSTGLLLSKPILNDLYLLPHTPLCLVSFPVLSAAVSQTGAEHHSDSSLITDWPSVFNQNLPPYSWTGVVDLRLPLRHMTLPDTASKTALHLLPGFLPPPSNKGGGKREEEEQEEEDGAQCWFSSHFPATYFLLIKLWISATAHQIPIIINNITDLILLWKNTNQLRI